MAPPLGAGVEQVEERTDAEEGAPPAIALAIARSIVRHPRRCLVALGLLAGLLAVGLLGLRFDPSTERIFPQGHPALRAFEEFRKNFGDDELITLAYEGQGPILSRAELERLQRLSARLKELPGARAVRSVITAPSVELKGFPPTPVLRPLFEKPVTGMSEAELAAAIKRFSALPFVRPLFLSKDGRCTALVVEVERKLDAAGHGGGEEEIHALVLAVRKVVKKELPGIEVHFAGAPIIKVEIVEAIVQDLVIFTIPLIVMAALIAWLIFRSALGVALPLSVILLTSVMLMGCLGALDFPITTMTSLLSPLMFVVGVADSIHVLVEIKVMERDTRRPREDAVALGTATVLVPCFVTSLTTAIGFGSLILSDILPVREFGGFAALGTIIAFLVTFLLIPSVWVLAGGEGEGAGPRDAPRLEGLADFVMGRLAPLAFACALITGAALFWVGDISFNTNFLDFFAEQTPIRRAARFIESRFVGVGTMEIIVEAPKGQLRKPKMLRAIMALEEELKALDHIDMAFSAADFLRAGNKLMSGRDEVPSSAAGVAILERVMARMQTNRRELAAFVTEDETRARISLRLAAMGSEDVEALLIKVRAATSKHLGFDERIHVTVTGTPVIFSETATFMLEGQLRSFFWALVSITIILAVTLRSWRLALVSLAPNLFPILVTFGAMGLLGIPLNSFNSMVASVAIGIAVDDTIHILVGYQRFRSRMPLAEALRETMAHTGAAVLSTSVVLACGFGILCLASFRPTAHFGFLTSVAIVSALVGDLFLLPGLLVLNERWLKFRCAISAEARSEEEVAGVE